MVRTILLETARLLVREFKSDDIGALHAILGDREVMQFIGDAQPFSMQKTGACIEQALAAYRTDGYGWYGVFLKRGGAQIGFTGLMRLVRDPGKIELDYGFGKPYWGQGFATEVARAMVQHAFAVHHLDCLYASVDPSNAKSIRVLEKLGMQLISREPDELGLPDCLYVLSCK